MGKGGDQREVIVSHHDQYNADPLRDIHIINLFCSGEGLGNG